MFKKVFLLLFVIISTVLLSSCEENYIGPTYLGLNTEKEILQETLIRKDSPFNLSSSKNKSVELASDSQMQLVNDQIYLVVNFSQPKETADIFEIVSLVLTYPSGASIKWSSTIRENSDPDSRSWYTNSDYTKIYIPITTAEKPNEAGFSYKVSAIKFISGTELKDVRFSEETSEKIIIHLKYRPISLSAPDSLGVFNLNNNTVTLDFQRVVNPDNLNFKKVWIKGTLIADGDYIPERFDYPSNSGGVVFSIPSEVNILNNERWIYAEIEFSDSTKIEGYLTKYNSELLLYPSISVYTNEDFYNLPKDLSFEATLFTDIVIDSSFIAFKGPILGFINYKSPDEIVATITFESNNIPFFSNDKDLCNNRIRQEFEGCASQLNLIDIQIEGNLILINNTNEVIYVNFFLFNSGINDFDFEIISLNGNISINNYNSLNNSSTNLSPQHYIYKNQLD